MVKNNINKIIINFLNIKYMTISPRIRGEGVREEFYKGEDPIDKRKAPDLLEEISADKVVVKILRDIFSHGNSDDGDSWRGFIPHDAEIYVDWPGGFTHSFHEEIHNKFLEGGDTYKTYSPKQRMQELIEEHGEPSVVNYTDLDQGRGGKNIESGTILFSELKDIFEK